MGYLNFSTDLLWPLDIVDIVALMDSFHSGEGSLRFEGSSSDRRSSRPGLSIDSDEGLPRSRINSAGSETNSIPSSSQTRAQETQKIDDDVDDNPAEEPLHDGFREVQLPK